MARRADAAAHPRHDAWPAPARLPRGPRLGDDRRGPVRAHQVLVGAEDAPAGRPRRGPHLRGHHAGADGRSPRAVEEALRVMARLVLYAPRDVLSTWCLYVWCPSAQYCCVDLLLPLCTLVGLSARTCFLLPTSKRRHP